VAKVLVVDDMADMRDLYTFYLRYAGMEAESAADGLEAIVKTRALKPDVVVMDLMMPGITGAEAIRRLKEEDVTRAIPIIALTASHEPEMKRDAVEAGCDLFLTKPCPPETLTAEIRRLLPPSVL
jgi:two-component system, cell cycle response regulator DivK